MNPSDLRFFADRVAADAFIAPGAVILGNVAIGSESSIWYQVVIRGDTAPIVIGAQTNIQDGTILHADPGFPCTIGDRVTVGHGALIHGATIEDDCLIGIRATILNGAKIGKGSLIGAGALITERMVIRPGSVVLGQPGQVKREVSIRDQERIRHATEHYVKSAAIYREALRAGLLATEAKSSDLPSPPAH